MAKTANSENVKRDVEGPDYPGAIQLIRGPIAANRSETSSLGQENSTLFKRIDKQCGVHRGAAVSFAGIDKMPEDKRTDYLRSLLGLLKHAGYGNFNDLVDRAQVVTPPAKKDAPAKKDLPEPAPGDADLREAGGPEAEGEADGTAGMKALAAARRHLSAVPDAI